MTHLHNPWPEQQRWASATQFEPAHLRTVGPDDTEAARRLMRGDDGPPLSLKAAAAELGVLAGELDKALWRRFGAAG